MRPIPLAALAFLPLAMNPSAASAQSDWIAKKCELYQAAWSRALSNNPDADINNDFLAANEHFIASGCTEKISVCPRSSAALELATMLTIIMLNEGAASTFLPFTCDDE
jgi:hypothetical protein